MEWTREERADLRRAEQAIERVRRSLKERGKWRIMWRIQDVQHSLQTAKAAVAEQGKSDVSSTPSVAQSVAQDTIDPNLMALIKRKIPLG